LLGPLHELHEAPALVLRQPPGLHEPDHVTHFAFVLLVVDLEGRATPHVPSDGGVLDQALDRDDHGLLHPVAHDLADPHLPAVPFLGHRALSFWCSTVSSRASSRRPLRILSGLSSCFIELRKRRLKISCRSSPMRSRISSTDISRIAVAFT